MVDDKELTKNALTNFVRHRLLEPGSLLTTHSGEQLALKLDLGPRSPKRFRCAGKRLSRDDVRCVRMGSYERQNARRVPSDGLNPDLSPSERERLLKLPYAPPKKGGRPCTSGSGASPEKREINESGSDRIELLRTELGRSGRALWLGRPESLGEAAKAAAYDAMVASIRSFGEGPTSPLSADQIALLYDADFRRARTEWINGQKVISADCWPAGLRLGDSLLIFENRESWAQRNRKGS